MSVSCELKWLYGQTVSIVIFRGGYVLTNVPVDFTYKDDKVLIGLQKRSCTKMKIKR